MLSPFGVRKAGRMSSGGQECGRGQWHALFLLYFWCTKIRILFLVMTIARTPYGWAVLGTGLYPEQHFSKHSAHQTIKGCTSDERFITLANGACERGGMFWRPPCWRTLREDTVGGCRGSEGHPSSGRWAPSYDVLSILTLKSELPEGFIPHLYSFSLEIVAVKLEVKLTSPPPLLFFHFSPHVALGYSWCHSVWIYFCIREKFLRCHRLICIIPFLDSFLKLIFVYPFTIHHHTQQIRILYPSLTVHRSLRQTMVIFGVGLVFFLQALCAIFSSFSNLSNLDLIINMLHPSS